MPSPRFNVLMLGWEIYPVFAGGMGVVTSEIVHGLTDANIGVHFVIPRLPQKIEIDKVNFTSAHEYVPQDKTINLISKKTSYFKKTYIDTIFEPYKTQNIYRNGYSTREEIFETKNSIEKSNSITSTKSLYNKEILRDIKMFEDRTAEIALESNFDLIHAHDWITFRAAITAKHLTGKPVVLHVHATEIDRSGNNPNKIVFDIEKECLEQADFVIAVSNKGKEDIINHYGINPSKITVIHNSTNFNQSHNRTIMSKKDKIVLFLGRITMQKGPEYFIYAASKVLKYLPNTIFIMAGEGDLLPRCIELVNDLNIEKNFLFTGNFVTGDDKNRLYASSDVFVMSSVSEPFGIVALEAIKSGTPVIISKNSGAAEIVKDALTIDFWDIDKLADMIHASLKYSSLHDELIENQEKNVNSQNWNHQIDVIIEIYKRAMNVDQ